MAEVKITISAEDGSQKVFSAVEAAGTSAFKKIEQSAVSSSSNISSAVEKCKESYVNFAAKVYTAWEAVKKAVDFAKLGASAMQAEESFKNVANAYGEDADKLLHKMKEVSAGIIDDSDLMQRALKALQQGLSGNQIVRLLEVARASARVAGTDIASAFDGITNAVANQTTRSLKLYGILLDQNKVFEEYAVKLGKSKDALTEMEQSQALANAAIEEGGRQMKAMGEITENASERIQKSEAQLHELKETIGKGLLVAIQAVGGLFYWLAGGVMVAASAFMELGAGILFATGRFKEARQMHQDAKIMFEAAGEQAGKGMDIWKGMSLTTKDAAAGTKGLAKAQQDAAAAASLHAAEQEKAKKVLEGTIKTLKEMSTVISTIGEARLKMSDGDFSEALKKEETGMAAVRAETELYLKSMASIEDKSAAVQAMMAKEAASVNAIATATEVYLNVIENVYAQRLAGEKAIAEQMKKAGADPAAMAQQQAKILQTEMAGANARLGAWKQYYTVLETLHKSALDKMAQKTQALIELEQARVNQWNGYADLYNGLRQKLMTDEQKYYDQLNIMQMKYDAAQQLSGEAKIKALTEWQAARASMANEIKSGDTVIISQETAVKDAMNAIARAQDDISKEYAETKVAREAELAQLKTYTEQLSTAMAKASEMVEHYKNEIIELDTELSKQRVLSIDASQAQQAVSAVQAALAAIPDITYKQVVVQYFTQASPVRPFTEGMRYINDMMNSLPTESRHTVKFGPLSDNVRSMSSAASSAQTSATDEATAGNKTTGMTDAAAKIMEELYLKLATAEGNLARAVEQRSHADNDAYMKMFSMQIEENEAIIRTLENAIAKLLGSVGGSYADGTRRVPETGLYQLHQDEAVIPAEYNPFINDRAYSERPAQQTNIKFAPKIQVISSGNPEHDAVLLDRKMAELWRGQRSELRQEIEQPTGRRYAR